MSRSWEDVRIPTQCDLVAAFWRAMDEIEGVRGVTCSWTLEVEVETPDTEPFVVLVCRLRRGDGAESFFRIPMATLLRRARVRVQWGQEVAKGRLVSHDDPEEG